MSQQLKVLYALVVISILLSLLGVVQTFRNQPVALSNTKTTRPLGAMQSKAYVDDSCIYQCQTSLISCPIMHPADVIYVDPSEQCPPGTIPLGDGLVTYYGRVCRQDSNPYCNDQYDTCAQSCERSDQIYTQPQNDFQTQ